MQFSPCQKRLLSIKEKLFFFPSCNPKISNLFVLCLRTREYKKRSFLTRTRTRTRATTTTTTTTTTSATISTP